MLQHCHKMDEEAGLVYFLTHVDTDIIQHSLSTILLQLSNTKNPTNSGNLYSIDGYTHVQVLVSKIS